MKRDWTWISKWLLQSDGIHKGWRLFFKGYAALILISRRVAGVITISSKFSSSTFRAETSSTMLIHFIKLFFLCDDYYFPAGMKLKEYLIYSAYVLSIVYLIC